jgi:hypothetical protein
VRTASETAGASRAVGRVAAVIVFAFGLMVVGASPAAAHTVSGMGATNWISKLTAVRPAVAGLRVRVIDLGNKLEVSNTGPDLVVLGYGGEPYLRAGPGGIFENLNSEATYINNSAMGANPVPQGLPTDPSAPPRWRKVSSGHVAMWHDHRIHWMGPSRPPDVRQAPSQVHVQFTWRIELRQGTMPITVNGELLWVPQPSPWPWLAAALALAVVCALLGRLRLWGPVLAVGLGLLVVVDVTHLIGIAWTYSGGLGTVTPPGVAGKLGRFVSASWLSFIGWILAGAAVRLLPRRSIDALYAAAFAAISTFFFSGLADLTALHRSQAPFLWGARWDRGTITVALGGGLGIALGSLWALRRARAEFGDAEPGSAQVVEVPELPTGER